MTFRRMRTAACGSVCSRPSKAPTPAGETGVIEFHGIRGKLSYDEQAQTVTATFHHVPRIVSRGCITGWLHDALYAAGHLTGR